MTTTTLNERPVRLVSRPSVAAATTERWSVDDVAALFNLPISELIHRAQTVHRERFEPTEVELAILLSVKAGGCPEDRGDCPQSVQFDIGVEAGKLMGVAAVREAAQRARQAGATRFCMGAAWLAPKDHDVDAVANSLRDAGVDCYNDNLDSAPDFYGEVITTRDDLDRLDTLEFVRTIAVAPIIMPRG